MRLSTNIKARGVALALGRLTGREPAIVEDSAGNARLYWPEDDLPVVRAWFEKQVESAAVPPDVSIDLVPVVGPYATRAALPAVLGTLLVGWLVGRFL